MQVTSRNIRYKVRDNAEIHISGRYAIAQMAGMMRESRNKSGTKCLMDNEEKCFVIFTVSKFHSPLR